MDTDSLLAGRARCQPVACHRSQPHPQSFLGLFELPSWLLEAPGTLPTALFHHFHHKFANGGYPGFSGPVCGVVTHAEVCVVLATVGPFVTASVSSIDMFAHGVEALVVLSVAVTEVEGGDSLEDFGCYLVAFARVLI